MKKTAVLGIGIDVLTMDETVDKVLSFFGDNGTKTVFTAGPEMIMYARKDGDYAQILNSGDLVTADGIGVVYASKRLKERVGGCDLVYRLFGRMGGKTAYFLGGAPGVAETAKANIERDFAGVSVVGVADGFFDAEREKLIIDEINRLSPDLLLVGTGFPRQEKWIFANKERLNCRVAVGVGGSLDIYAGNVKRAPKFWVRLNLEWFYRLITEPRKRFKRQLQLPLFVMTVLFNRRKES